MIRYGWTGAVAVRIVVVGRCGGVRIRHDASAMLPIQREWWCVVAPSNLDQTTLLVGPNLALVPIVVVLVVVVGCLAGIQVVMMVVTLLYRCVCTIDYHGGWIHSGRDIVDATTGWCWWCCLLLLLLYHYYLFLLQQAFPFLHGWQGR